METIDTLLNPYVLSYLVIVVIAQVAVFSYRYLRREKVANQREKAGLPRDQILLDHSQKLADLRKEALTEALVLLLTLMVLPFLLMMFVQGNAQAQRGLALSFAVAVIWLLWAGTTVSKSFLGGLVFKAFIAVKHPFQVGDRVTLRGHCGKVKEIGLFYVTLQSSNDEQISVPSGSLLSQVLVSANAGKRSSLCVMDFYLAPFVGTEQRKAVEDTIRDALQASTYMEPSKPMQLVLSQESDAIRLTAKVYVASSYNEELFKSDVYRAFLDFVATEGIPLAARSWRQVVLSP